MVKRTNNIYAPAALALGILVLFILVFIFRFYRFGELSAFGNANWRINAEYSLNMIQSWLNLGLLHSNITMQLRVVYPDSMNLFPYYSYPQGFVAIPYFFAKIFGWKEVELSFVDAYSAIQHFLISVSLSLFTFYTLKEKIKQSLAWAFAFFIGIYALVQPPLFLFYQFSYFSDQASVFPYIVFLGIFYFTLKNPHKYNIILLSIASFWGAWTDHSLTILIVFSALLVWRSFESGPEKRKILLGLVVPTTIAIVLFLFPLFVSIKVDEMAAKLFLKFSERSGLTKINKGGSNLGSYWSLWKWVSYIGSDYGKIAKYFVFFNLSAGFIFFIRTLAQKKINPEESILILSTLPLFIHSLLFVEHYFHHSYNLVRLIIPITLPIIFYVSKARGNYRYAVLGFSIIALTGSTMGALPSTIQSITTDIDVADSVKSIGQYIRKNAKPSDVVLNFESQSFSTPLFQYRIPVFSIESPYAISKTFIYLTNRSNYFPDSNFHILTNRSCVNFFQKTMQPIAIKEFPPYVLATVRGKNYTEIIGNLDLVQIREKIKLPDSREEIKEYAEALKAREPISAAPLGDQLKFIWNLSWSRWKAKVLGT